MKDNTPLQFQAQHPVQIGLLNGKQMRPAQPFPQQHAERLGLRRVCRQLPHQMRPAVGRGGAQ